MNFGGNMLDSNNHAADTPEAISKAVACLPAGQMFELMTQMKGCIQNNPMEARTMLAKNPQLAYALLQAQIIMKIFDPKDFMTAMTSTSSQATMISNNPITTNAPIVVKTEPVANPLISALGSNLNTTNVINLPPQPVPAPLLTGVPQPVPAPSLLPVSAPMAVPPPIMGTVMAPPIQGNVFSDVDLRAMDPRMQRGTVDQDMRNLLNRPAESTNFPADPRQRPPEISRNDPRLAKAGAIPTRPPPSIPAPTRQNVNPTTAPTSDQDKTALIMQVLQLSDEQIALLPPEQRSSILLLKEQIARTTQR